MAIAVETYLVRRRGFRRWSPLEEGSSSPPPPPGTPVDYIDLQSPDNSLWYRVSAIEISAGLAELQYDGPVAAGSTAYLVLPFGLDFYKVQIRTDEGYPVLEIQTTPVAEPESGVIFTTLGSDYELTIVNDGGLTFELVPV